MVRQMSQVYVTGLACVRQMSQVYVTGLACGASDVTGLACDASDVTGLCHRFGMCHGVCASDVTGLACGASDVTGLACAMASVRQMSQVWHVSWRLCVRCHGVRASDVMSRNVKTAAAILAS